VSIEQVVVWVSIGGLAGLQAAAFVKGIRLGLAGAIVVGMLGGLIGGGLFGLLGLSVGGGILGDILVAFVGAVVLLRHLARVETRVTQTLRRDSAPNYSGPRGGAQ